LETLKEVGNFRRPLRAQWLLKGGVFAFPLVIIFCLAFLGTLNSDLYSGIARSEDGPVEDLTSFAYFLAFLCALIITLRFFGMRPRRNLLGFLYLFLSLALIFVCMEEISWGQRILDLSPTGFFEERNAQDEISLHNLEVISPRWGEGFNYVSLLIIVAGFVGAFTWLVLSTKMKNNTNATVYYFVPNWYLTLYFLPVSIHRLYADISRWYFDSYSTGGGFAIAAITHKEAEPAEMLFAFGVLLFMIINLYRSTIGAGGAHT